MEREEEEKTSVLEYQIQACKKPMPGKTWYVGTREVRWLHTLKDKVYMVSPETSIYKDLLISIAFPRFPLNPPFSSFFFFFFLVNLQNRLNIQQYHNISCPPRCELHSSCSPLYSIWRFAKALAHPHRQSEATNPNLDLNAALRYRDVTIIQT